MQRSFDDACECVFVGEWQVGFYELLLCSLFMTHTSVCADAFRCSPLICFVPATFQSIESLKKMRIHSTCADVGVKITLKA